MMAWGDRRLANVTGPVLVAGFATVTDRSGPPWRKALLFRVSGQAPDGAADGLVGTMLDRLREITTHAAFAALGIDTSVRPGVRSPADDLQVGGSRKIQDYSFDATVVVA